MEPFSISSTVQTYPKLDYQTMKDDILGKRYQLSLSFVGATRARQFNSSYRNKTYVPNVLSFPLTDTQGEIVIAPAVAKKEAKKFNMTEAGYHGFLFIHGCLHLKGYDHGDTMDRLEKKYVAKYSLT